MAEKPQSPFAALGVDKALLRSTKPQEAPPASQQDNTLSHQHNSKPVSQPASKPVPQLVKATFYLTPENIMQLEQLRLERLQKGEKADKSALVREAIEKIVGKTA